MQFVRQNKGHAICTDSKMTFASRGLRVKLATANLSGTGHGEQRGQRTGQEVRMSGKQQKGEAISRAARAETGARAGGKCNWHASINRRVGTSISAKSQCAAATFAA